MDSHFRVSRISATPLPQRTCWAAMHQDYAEGFVEEEIDQWPDETAAGQALVKHLLAGERGHYGPLEHAQIVLNVGWFPHSVMQQARTHRVGVSFDVQSGRYTGNRICKAATGELDIEDVFYLRPVGEYRDRQGKRYAYSANDRATDLYECVVAANRYATKLSDGYSEEHARGTVPFDIRQHFVVSFTLRALMHFLDLRAKADAQLEIQQLCEIILPCFREWTPQVADWYISTRWGKARLAP